MKLHELFAKPGTWTQRHNARDKNGAVVDHYHPDAVKFCIMGGLHKCYGENHEPAYHAISAKLVERGSPNGDITPWNDAAGRTQAEVHQLCLDADV
jgi:hypothetical protein